MDITNMKLTVELTSPDGTVYAAQENVWKGLDYQKVLFLQKHLLGALSAMNAEAEALVKGSIGKHPEAGNGGPGNIR